MDDEQQQRFAEAVERKKQEADAAARGEHDQNPSGSTVSAGEQASLVEHGRTQDVADPRAKNSGHGKKTADKWNQ
jgi:hypothetical protein